MVWWGNRRIAHFPAYAAALPQVRTCTCRSTAPVGKVGMDAGLVQYGGNAATAAITAAAATTATARNISKRTKRVVSLCTLCVDAHAVVCVCVRRGW